MSNWRDSILNEFTAPDVAQLTLVSDPDGLLFEPRVHEAIEQRGFHLLPYDEPVKFRYVYESQYRSRWERGEKLALVVVSGTGRDVDSLPYDLLQVGRRLSFSLANLFPTLNYPIVAALDRSHLDALFDAQRRYSPGYLGEAATKEFILRHVFDLAPELIKQPHDLLRLLLRRHYRSVVVPPVVDEHLIEILKRDDQFKSWPLDEIVPNKEAFFAFLQERWPIFLDAQLGRARVAREVPSNYGLTFSGPTVLPFDHPDVRVYIDNLFVEGILHPVEHDAADVLLETMKTFGIKVPNEGIWRQRAEALLKQLDDMIPEQDARYDDWLRFAAVWAELIALVFSDEGVSESSFIDRLAGLRKRVDSRFLTWVQQHYGSLVYLPPTRPVMLHHVPRYLARRLSEDARAKIAFVLIDGLAMDQWVVLRESLAEQEPSFVFREDAVFAWVPTITSVSRQAAFAGEPPMFFPDFLHTTDKEPGLWIQFWLNHGLQKHQVAYAKGLGDGDFQKLEEQVSQPNVRVLGLVVDKVDRIMHGIELGTAGMHNQVRQWARTGFMRNLLALLHGHGFTVFLASDHGNIEARGVGRPREGSIAEYRGLRTRFYSTPRLRAQVKDRFPEAIEWPAIGLPEGSYVLLAQNRAAFVADGKTVVCHGGISVEEVIVPFVEVSRRGR